MASTEQERKAAFLAGVSVEEWQRRGRVALGASQHATVGGFVMCEVSHRGDRTVRMKGSDSYRAHEMTAAKMAQEARDHIDKFLADPNEEKALEHLARAGGMTAAALSRCARDGELRAKVASGRGLLG